VNYVISPVKVVCFLEMCNGFRICGRIVGFQYSNWNVWKVGTGHKKARLVGRAGGVIN
jgi:hypothetical protein